MRPLVVRGIACLLVGAQALAISAADSRGGATPEALEPAAIRELLARSAAWQLAQPSREVGDWTNAVFYVGLGALYRATADRRYLDELSRVGERLRWQPGPRLRHADDHVIAQVYLELFELRQEPGMIAPFRDAVDRMMAQPARWEKRHQVIDYWWSDALFMSPPALARLAAATGDERYLDFMDRLWRQSYDLLWNERAQLFHRDLRFRERESEEFWSRGNAWVLAGLARTLDHVPEERPTRTFYVEVFRALAESVVALQPPEGLWQSSLLERGRRPDGETSGSALFCSALLWGVRTGVLDRDQFWPAAERSWIALFRSVDPDGRLGWVQKPGASPARVRAADHAAYGTGALLLAGTEMLALLEGPGFPASRSE